MKRAGGLIFAERLHMTVRGGCGWRVGITADPENALFVELSIDRERGSYGYVDCGTFEAASEAADALVARGYDPGERQSGETAAWLYVYEIAAAPPGSDRAAGSLTPDLVPVRRRGS